MGDPSGPSSKCRWGRLAEPGFLVALASGGPPDRTGFAGGGRGRVPSGSPGCFVGCSQAPWTRYGASGRVDRSAYAFRILHQASSQANSLATQARYIRTLVTNRLASPASFRRTSESNAQ